MIIYDKFWKTLKQKGISQYELIHKYGISTGQLQRIRENRNMYLTTINRLCEILECKIEDIMEFHKE